MQCFPWLATAVTAIVSLTAACAAPIETEARGATSSRVTRGSCAEVGEVDTEAKVTADTSGVKCYDSSGTYVDSVAGSVNGTTSIASVQGGTVKTFSGKSGNFVRVSAKNSSGDALDCWMSTLYLCATTAAAEEKPKADPPAADTTPDVVETAPAEPNISDVPTGEGASMCLGAHQNESGGGDAARSCCDQGYAKKSDQARCRAEVTRLIDALGLAI